MASIVTFTRVRIVLLRANGDTALTRVVEFPPESASLALALPVTLDPAAPTSGELLTAALRFINAAGDTVFRGGPVNVVAATPTAPPTTPPEIPLTYTGVGANAASVAITPTSRTVRHAETVAFTATVRDAQGATLAGTPVAFTSRDTTKVRVGITSGSAQVTGFRGATAVIAQTVTGQRDSALVTITPTPTALAVVAGNAQQVIQRLPFPAPVQLRVTAGDNLPVSGEIVAFTVTAGQGTLSQARDTSDANGLVEVQWTAGAVTGTGALRAEVVGAPTAVVATVSGTQLAPPAAATLRLTGQSVQVAGDSQTVRITALDALGNRTTVVDGLRTVGIGPCQGAATGEVLTTQGPVAFNDSASVTFATGVADVVIRPFTASTYDLCASLLGSTVTTVPGQRLALTVAPARPTHFRLAAPVAWTAGVPQGVTVTAYDDYENVAKGLTSLITSVLFTGPGASPNGTAPTMLAVGGSTVPLSNNPSLAFTNGVATSTLTLYRNEGTALAASANPATGPITTRSTDVIPVNVLPGPTSALAFSTGLAGVFNGTAFTTQPVVTAVDAYGNGTGAGGIAVTASIASGTGTLGGTLTRTTVAGNGSATFTDLGITGAGTHTVRFSAPGGLVAAVSSPFPVAPVSPGIRLHAGASDRTSAVVGSDLAIPLLIDLSNRGGADLASLTAYVAWDTTRFTYVGTTAGAWTDDAGGSASVFLNTANTGAGQLVISGFTANATTASFVLRTLTLRPRIAGAATVDIAAGASGNAAGGAVSVVVRPLAVTVTP